MDAPDTRALTPKEPESGAAETPTTRLADAVNADAGRAATNRIVPRLLAALLGLALFYTLALAQSFLVPVALAFLTSLVLAPVVRWLQRKHIPRAFGAGLVVAVLLSTLAYGVSASLEPVGTWFEQAPRVLRQLERKVYSIKRTVADVSKAADQVDRLASVSTAKTIEIKDVSYRDMLYDNAGSLLTGAAMATLLLYFFLSWGGVALLRVGEQFGEGERRRRFLALSRTLEGEVSKYLSTITLINLGLGVAVAAHAVCAGDAQSGDVGWRRRAA